METPLQYNKINELLQIKRDPNETIWVGYNLSYEPGLIVQPNCPFDYCVNDKVLFSLNAIDMQCAHNRSGLYSVDSV